MSDYDVIIDDVTKTCFNFFFKSHSESYVIGRPWLKEQNTENRTLLRLLFLEL